MTTFARDPMIFFTPGPFSVSKEMGTLSFSLLTDRSTALFVTTVARSFMLIYVVYDRHFDLSYPCPRSDDNVKDLE